MVFRNKLKLWQIILFVAGITVPIISVIILNYLYTGTLTGFRLPSRITFYENIVQLFKTIYDCYLPNQVPFYLKKILLILFVSVTSFGLLKQFRNLNNKFRLLLIITSAYLISLVLLSSFVWIDGISARLIAPVFIPLTILLVKSLEIFINKHFIITIMLILCLIGAIKSGGMINNSIKNGIGEFSTKEWRQSQIIEFLQKQKYSKVIYSNFPDAINYFVNVNAKLITDNSDKAEMMLGKISSEKAILIILNKETYRNVISQKIIEKYMCNSYSLIFNDGKIYLF